MQKFKPAFAPILILLLFGAIAVGGFVFLKQKPLSQSVHVGPTPSLQDETANWKTYINTDMGFSVKYPEKELPYITKSEDALISGVTFAMNKDPYPQGASYHGIYVGISDLPTDSNNQNFDINKYADTRSLLDPKPRKKLTIISGEKAAILYGVKHADILTTVDTYVAHNGKLFEISLIPDNPNKYIMFDQILSTFRFE